MAYLGLEPKSSHTIKVLSSIELVLFHMITIRIKCLKGSYYLHLLNNYLINYSNFSGLTAILKKMKVSENNMKEQRHKFIDQKINATMVDVYLFKHQQQQLSE